MLLRYSYAITDVVHIDWPTFIQGKQIIAWHSHMWCRQIDIYLDSCTNSESAALSKELTLLCGAEILASVPCRRCCLPSSNRRTFAKCFLCIHCRHSGCELLDNECLLSGASFYVTQTIASCRPRTGILPNARTTKWFSSLYKIDENFKIHARLHFIVHVPSCNDCPMMTDSCFRTVTLSV